MTEGTGRSAVRRVAAARGISLTGSGAAFAVLAYIVYRLTGNSAIWLSMTLLLTMGVQGLVQPIASWLGDRFDRRRAGAGGGLRGARGGASLLRPSAGGLGARCDRRLVLVGSDLCAAGGFVALAFARTPGQLLAIASITAILEPPVWAVAGASIPNLIDEEHLPWANGQVAIGRHLGSFIGPLLGTQLIALLAGNAASADRLLGAGAFVYGLNTASFLFSAWLIGSTPGRFNDERPAKSEHAGIRAGLRCTMSDRVLRAILLGWSVLLLGVGLILVAELPYALSFGKG